MNLFINDFLSKIKKIVLCRFLTILTFNEIVLEVNDTVKIFLIIIFLSIMQVFNHSNIYRNCLEVNDTVEIFLIISAIVKHCFVKQR